MNEWLECSACHKQHDATSIRDQCDCGGLLSVERPPGWPATISTKLFDSRLGSRNPVDRSGVWRFREAVSDVDPTMIITHPEGGTNLYERDRLSEWAGLDWLRFKHEGENPTGSFKDRGMTVAMTHAERMRARAVGCASTGNTSSSLASYAAQAGKNAVVFVPSGKISMGKLAQTLAYGALCLQVRGDFDTAMKLALESSRALKIYLLNSINPFRIEGQKTIVWEALQDLAWDAPDWIVFPAGNLGNAGAFGKALREAHEGGWIRRMPRLAAVQASGANPFYRSFRDGFQTRHRVEPETVATAIRIGDPVSFDRARAAIEGTRGVVEEVTDAEILEAKRQIDSAGLGCEPASAASLAGVRKLRASGTIKKKERVICILTGHLLKDTDIILKSTSPRLIEIDPTVAAVEKALA